ncbi:hypothetical protein [Streptomyces indicus]|uniref:DUF4034 domain-containing protein n=1 Tax=Streptomyces indicus TaxID=417292 RepID=A0A1G8YZU7_9ACTN|nr:hypothetical protein [Streptomyces indicus]SDK08358.1 hypothetical protein SAMN05421806_104359 [Streptomyces indicus]
MALLRALIGTARMLKHTRHLALGLPADDEMLLDAPDDRLAPALVAAGRDDYESAAQLLAATREEAAWESRDLYSRRLAAFARSRPDWFERWLADRPQDPDALLVKAELALARAWESPAYAELLRDAAPLIGAASAAGHPRDPVPWRLALDHARGTHASRGVFDALWQEATSRASHHYGCHTSAVQYLSAAWYGSHRECFDFAERAAEDALPGSLIHALPARAALAYLTGPGSSVPRARLDAAADRAIVLSAAYEAGDPYPAEVRNVLTYVLIRLERWQDALEQLRLIGAQATSFPWDRISDDPLGQFLELRDGVRLEVASATPLRARRTPGGH